MFDYEGIQFHWMGHDGFRIVGYNKKTVYTDPFQIQKAQQNKNDANILLISHNHFDHLSMEDLKHVINHNTSIVAAEECIEQLKGLEIRELKDVRPGDRLEIEDTPIEIIPAYNTNKKFHPKDDKKVGFIFTINNQRIYHAGDTDIIPEMKSVNVDIAIVPVSGTYVMTSDEAAQAVNDLIKPRKFVIPMHYGSIVGTEKDAERFRELVKVCETKILDRE
jgi:L-ascorbate metabolism protein UlaG (beta-lactamase superfamily)